MVNTSGPASPSLRQCAPGETISIDAMIAAAGFVDLPPEAGISVQDADGHIVAASAQAECILGLTLDEMRGRTSHDPRWAAVDESGRPLEGARHPAMLALKTVVAIRNSVIGVHRPRTEAPGRYVWLDVDAVPLTAPGEAEPRAVVTAFRPIGGERLRQLELRDSERLYRMIAEHTSDMVAWQLVTDSTFLWVSPASSALLGVAPDELVGLSSVDFIHAEDRDALERWRQTIVDCGCAPKLTVRMRHADGSFVWVERTAHVLPVDPEAPLQMITVQRDVTDRVQAEQARDAAVRLFEVAMAHATIGMALRRADGTVFRVNPALCAMLGRTVEELVGHHLWEFTAGPDPEADRGLRAVEVGEADHHEVERQFRRPDGSLVWCIRTVIGLPGHERHLLVQLQDITVSKEAAVRLERAAQTDSLTGLPNRSVLEDCLTKALAAAQRNDMRVGVLFVDLDEFKSVNDGLGHDVGDALLREVGIRLQAAVRRDDIVVRFGGDEFVVVYGGLSEAAELAHAADRIRAAFSHPFMVSGHEVLIAASIGTSVSAGAVSPRELVTIADDAMYRRKRSRQAGGDHRLDLRHGS